MLRAGLLAYGRGWASLLGRWESSVGGEYQWHHSHAHVFNMPQRCSRWSGLCGFLPQFKVEVSECSPLRAGICGVEWVGRVTITRWVVALDRTAPGRGRLFCCFGQMQQPTQVSAVVSDVLECNWCPSPGLFIYESSVSLPLCNRSAGLTSRTPGA